MNPIELGKFIANLRNEKNLTQEDLAEKLYIDKRKISRWECGTSTPEFEMLIKLSEILDVSLFELSICRRIDDKHMGKRILNKLKNMKDYRKYKAKNVFKSLFIIILLVFFSITVVYTFKNSGTVEVYELQSTDENIYIDGNYIKASDYSSLNIYKIKDINRDINDENNNISINECEYEIYCNNNRLMQINNVNNNFNKDINILEKKTEASTSSDCNYKIQINCPNNKDAKDTYSFNFILIKKYDNKLF